jgi:oligoendopeptidase F
MNTQKDTTLPTWDLSVLYGGPNDPRIDTDTSTFEKLAKDFYNTHHGNVAVQLEQALRDFLALYTSGEQGIWYLENLQNLDQQNQEVRKKKDEVRAKIAITKATYTAFFENEIAAMSMPAIEQLSIESELIRRHIPYFATIINEHTESLPPQVETALAARVQIGSLVWEDLYDKQMAKFSFPVNNHILKKHEVISILISEPNSNTRARALSSLNCTLSNCFRDVTASAMSVVAAENRIENTEKKRPHVASKRFSNDKISQETFDALREACFETAVPLAKKYFTMKSKILGEKPLRWSSRRGPIQCYETKISYPDALALILEAFHNFDPQFSAIVEKTIANKWIDAAPGAYKAQRTYCASRVLNNELVALVLMTWENTITKTQYLGHELGHLIHFTLSAIQGPLLEDPGNTLGEIASLFCELLT